MGPELSCFGGAILSACGGNINVDDIVAFCLYLMKKAVDCHYLLFL